MRWHALGISDEIDSQPKKARKSTFRLGRKLGFPSALKFGEQLTVRDRDFDHSGVGTYSPEVLLPVGAGVFRQDFGGDFYFGGLVVGGLADPVLAAAGGLV